MAPPMWLEQSMGIMRASVTWIGQRPGGQSALRALFDHAPRRSAGQIRAQQPLAQSGSASLSLEVSIARTAPKYVAAVGAKDAMEELLAQDDDMTMASSVLRSIKKSVAASIAGSIVTNPLDVAQNEMYQTGDSFLALLRHAF
ncbi:Slc25a25 [Symbiodinium sp. CCMP2592]|nr:Slc25a25 [Symbiodinium sp. CCMP2592]